MVRRWMEKEAAASPGNSKNISVFAHQQCSVGK